MSLIRGKTVIVHRPPPEHKSARRTESWCWIGGRIVEQGAHEQLLDRGGLYRRDVGGPRGRRCLGAGPRGGRREGAGEEGRSDERGALQHHRAGTPRSLVRPSVACLLDGLCKIVPAALILEVFNVVFRHFQGTEPLNVARLWTVAAVLFGWMAVQYVVYANAYDKTYRVAYESLGQGAGGRSRSGCASSPSGSSGAGTRAT